MSNLGVDQAKLQKIDIQVKDQSGFIKSKMHTRQTENV
jgi:hypothetical protein